MTTRREFLKGTAWLGAVAALGGVAKAADEVAVGGNMAGFAVKPIETVRVGVAGLGMRGPGAVHRLASIPGVKVVALCDLFPERVERQNNWLTSNGYEEAASYVGQEAYKAMCESELDLVYIVTPWKMHTPIALYAMEHGKHAAIEVPSAMYLEECWALVETAQRTGRHCMQLENCCYGEIEMLALNMVRKGILGDLVHGEGAYIHDLRELNYLDPAAGGYQNYWRLKWNAQHYGNPYATHGLLPVMQSMNINRGDRMDYLTCVSSDQVGMDAYAKVKFGETSWQARLNPKLGDMSTTVIKTVKGKTIMVQHDVTSPRPYSRINLLSGTRGIIRGIGRDYDFQVALADAPGEGAHAWADKETAEKIADEYQHPLWKVAGEIAQKVGGHGGMDFLMDLRLCYCLQNGLPLDMDVYDLASSCAVAELSEKSACNRGASYDVPDFTCGGWQTAKPLGIESVSEDMVNRLIAQKDDSALNV
ncbi:MAG: Gfo/Idh/MocA family oxidoreductase [Kiritimatiellae bacterium]|nr:Gfo/Idh/MocA family oxidoreductase [Kiritimatiellia bacterium]